MADYGGAHQSCRLKRLGGECLGISAFSLMPKDASASGCLRLSLKDASASRYLRLSLKDASASRYLRLSSKDASASRYLLWDFPSWIAAVRPYLADLERQ